MYSFEKFVKSRWSLVIIGKGKIIFKSQASGIKPLVTFIKKDEGNNDQDLVIYDRYIGRAAALLMVLINPSKVYTPVISEGGRDALEEYKITYFAQQQVKYLMGYASDKMCRWEKMAMNKTPQELWEVLHHQSKK
ncbi:MAG: DUF1893 domain-containing protein [FCB group bacterium]|nr:DUF1893 domain-containing protein [FCB group bacterium]